MRLFQAMAGARHGGAEAFFERLAIALQKNGMAQQVAIRGDAARAGRMRAAGVAVAEFPFGGFFDFKTRGALRRAVQEFEPQVLLSWMNRATKFCSSGDYVRVARLGGFYDLKYYRNCDHLIGNTHGIVDYIRKHGWAPDRVHYVPNFVSAAKVAPVPRASLDTPDDVTLLVALGRLHPNKGFDVLLAAMEKLPDAYLWLAGEGAERAMLEAQAQNLGGRVKFLGWREDIAGILAAADIFVCPSRHEPLGNVVIEAWAAGKPVVAAASDGPRELIEDHVTGILVPIENADRLAQEVANVATDKSAADRLAAAGRAEYEAQFSEARVVALYREFFEKVAH